MATVEELKAKYKGLMLEAREVAGKYEDGVDIPAEDLSKIKNYMEAANGAKKEWEELAKNAGESDSVRAGLKGMEADLGLSLTPEKEKRSPAGLIEAKSVGDAFTKSATYQELQARLKAMSPNQVKNTRIQTDPIKLKSLVTGLSDSSAGAFVETDKLNILEPLGREPLTMRSVMTTGSTDSDTVEYMMELTNTNNADFVPEATSSAPPTVTVDGNAQSAVPLVNNAGGGYKPEGAFTWGKDTQTVKTMAEWIPATKRALADAGQMRTLIDQKLREDLKDKEDDALLNGSGTGESIRGILTSGWGIQTLDGSADSYVPTGLSSGLGVTLRGKSMVETIGKSNPNAYVMNSADVEALTLQRLLKGDNTDGAYGDLRVPTLHGLPIVKSSRITAGTALVGDFSKAIIWDREGVSVTATDSHADFFIRNLVAILAEYRFAFGIVRPSAFVKITNLSWALAS